MENNTTLLAVVCIRNLVLGLSNDWESLKQTGKAVDLEIDKASKFFINNAAPIMHERWLLELGEVQKNVLQLKRIMQEAVDKINTRNTEQLSEIWGGHKAYSDALAVHFSTMQELGRIHLDESLYPQWEILWKGIRVQFKEILDLAQGSQLHLAMVEEYTPSEINTITDTILRNMPKNYSEKEATAYEQEYMEAYAQLQSEASQKKNLWDRFLDLLAGGAQQTPAQMVMMKRWVDGEKGDL